VLGWMDKLAGLWLAFRTRRNALGGYREPELKSIEINDKCAKAVIAHPQVAFFADECSALLNAAEVENYLEFEMQPRADHAKGRIRVTIQWAHGLSPAQKAIKLEKELADLK
jgi:hypothetical protein